MTEVTIMGKENKHFQSMLGRFDSEDLIMKIDSLDAKTQIQLKTTEIELKILYENICLILKKRGIKLE